MIETVYSNSYDFLERYLIERVIEQKRNARQEGLEAALAPAEIIVPGQAVQDALMRGFADRLGIASALHMQYIGQWLESATGAMVGNSARGRELEWIVWALLNDEEFLARDECARLAHYCAGQPQVALSQLARRISAVFATYVSYRLDWVLEWMHVTGAFAQAAPTARQVRESRVLAAHPDAAWQKAMWAEIATRRWADQSKVWQGLFDLQRVPDNLRALAQGQGDKRPLHVFLPNHIPPLALPFLWASAQHRTITVYLNNPSRAFWFDAIGNAPEAKDDRRSADTLEWLHRNGARQRALIERIWTFTSGPDTAAPTHWVEDDIEAASAPLTGERRIEAAQGIDVRDVLQLHVEHPTDPISVYVEPQGETVLAALQRAVLDDDATALPDHVADGDNSFVIVKATNATREVEAVFDWIESLRDLAHAQNRPFHADDVLVVTPDLPTLAPIIAAVASDRAKGEGIAVRIAGQAEIDVNSAAQALLAAGNLIHARADCDSLMALMEFPIVAVAHGLLGADLELVRTWLVTAGYRWGLDAEHAMCAIATGQAQDEGDDLEGTLERALERLLMGSLMRDDVREPFYDVLPTKGTEVQGFESESTIEQTALFQALLSFCDGLLRAWRAAPSMDASAQQWLQWTHVLVHELMRTQENQKDVVRFMQAAARAARSAQQVLKDDPIGFEAFWYAVSEQMSEQSTPARATGAVTFAPMEPFRGLSYRAIAVMGLNDGTAFPGVNRSEEFDLMFAQADIDGAVQNARRRGDRDSRSSNRNVFLDLVLSAKDHFMVSYTIGLEATERLPSVVLEDLKQTLASGLGGQEAIEKSLTVRLSASEFDADNFTDRMGLFQSRHTDRLQAMQAAQHTHGMANEQVFLDAPLLAELPATGCITEYELAQFILDPEKWVETKAGVDSISAQDRVRLDLKAPDSPLWEHKVKRTLLTQLCEQADLMQARERIFQQAQFDPMLGAPRVRELGLRESVDEVSALLTMHRALCALWPESESMPAGRYLVADQTPFGGIDYASKTVRNNGTEAGVIVEMALSYRDVLRHFLRYLVRAAAAQNAPAPAMMSLKYKNNAKVFYWSSVMPGSTQQERAQRYVRNMLEIVNWQATAAMVYANSGGDSDALCLSTVWRGQNDSKERLSAASKAWHDALKSDTTMEYFTGDISEDVWQAINDALTPLELVPMSDPKKTTSKKKEIDEFELEHQAWKHTVAALKPEVNINETADSHETI